jgi:hypothetical protein
VAGWQELAASFFSTVPGHLLCKLAKKRSGVLSLLVVLHTNDSFFFHSHFWMAHTSISIIPRNTSSRFPQTWWKKKKTPLPHPSPKLELTQNQQHTLTI